MSMHINDDEKNQKIEEFVKEKIEIKQRIKDKLKKEINEIDFILTKSKIDAICSLVQEDIETYFKIRKEEYELGYLEELSIKEEDKRKFFNNLLKDSFKELEIFVKINKNSVFNTRFNGKYFLFKEHENVLIALLIENFSRPDSAEEDIEIYISRKELEEYIKIYEVRDDFIERLKENQILTEEKYNKDD